MNSVAAEIAEEIGVFFENADVNAGAGEQEAEHHAGRPASNNATASLDGGRHADDSTGMNSKSSRSFASEGTR